MLFSFFERDVQKVYGLCIGSFSYLCIKELNFALSVKLLQSLLM